MVPRLHEIASWFPVAFTQPFFRQALYIMWFMLYGFGVRGDTEKTSTLRGGGGVRELAYFADEQY